MSCSFLKAENLNVVILSSTVMAISGMGDALLYAYLPVNGKSMGMSAIAIGLILSVNKFIRFFSNRWVAYVAKHIGIRSIFYAGVLLAGITTISYTQYDYIALWLASRLAWGFAFSALRFSTLQFAVESNSRGKALGVNRAIQEAGPLLVYWTGPILIFSFGSQAVFIALGLVSLTSFVWCRGLPDHRYEDQSIKPFSFQRPGLSDMFTFWLSFIAEGLLIVGMFQLLGFSAKHPENALIITAGFISSRRLLNVVASLFSGSIADKVGQTKVLHTACLTAIAGLLLLAFGLSTIGLLLAFTGAATYTTLMPAYIRSKHRSDNSFAAHTKQSTSRDVGSALGTLLGLDLLQLLPQTMLLTGLTLILTLNWYYLYKL